MKRWILAGGMCILLTGALAAEGSNAFDPAVPVRARWGSAPGILVLGAAPSLDILIAQSRDYYSAGVGMRLSGACGIRPPLDLRLSLAYGYSSLVTVQALSRLSATGGIGR